MGINLRYNATSVDEIEQITKNSIDVAVNDTRMSNIILFIQKGLVDENTGKTGVSKAVATDVIDKYLVENDKDDLVLDIMEALVNSGFLSRKLDVDKMRKATAKRQELVNKQLDNVIKAK